MPGESVPFYNRNAPDSGCCPRFDPQGWDGLELTLADKLFVRAVTHAVFHVPVDTAKVFARVYRHLDAARAFDPRAFFVLSRDLGAWSAEHYFAAATKVPGEEMVRLSGRFRTKVFDEPHGQEKRWHKALKAISAAAGKPDGEGFFYYTTCPKCAARYGHNYVVGFAEI